jgi:hypothetical protein
MLSSGKPDETKRKPARKMQMQTAGLRSAHLALDPEWRYLAPLREAALTFLPVEIAPIAQSLSAWMLGSYVDRLSEVRTLRGSLPKMRLQAAMLDLRHTARWLAITAESANDSDLKSDNRLAGFADELAVAVQRLAGLIDEQLTPRRPGGRSSGRRP